MIHTSRILVIEAGAEQWLEKQFLIHKAQGIYGNVRQMVRCSNDVINFADNFTLDTHSSHMMTRGGVFTVEII